MEQETFFNILTGHYGEILETHAMWQCIASLGIKPFKYGNQWCYLYGDNIQEGICGFGSTIYEAAWDFYSNIKTEEARQAKPEVFDTIAFQKGVQEGRRLEREEALTIADIEKLHTFLYAVKNNKQGSFTFTRLSDEQYEEVLQRFNNAKEK